MTYVDPDVVVSLSSEVELIPFSQSTGAVFNGWKYFLGVGVMVETISGYEEWAGRKLSVTERFRAVAHYARTDAYVGSLSEILDD